MELTRNPQVNAFALFIASFGDEATRLQQALPLGKAFVVLTRLQCLLYSSKYLRRPRLCKTFDWVME
jgi:hypothetical protein